MSATERDLVSRLLKQSIMTMCRETVSYNQRLEVDGIICLTVDSQSQHVVKIHELFQKRSMTQTALSEALNGRGAGKSETILNQTTQTPSVHFEGNTDDIINDIKIEYSDEETEIVNLTDVNSENTHTVSDEKQTVKVEKEPDVKTGIFETAITAGLSSSPQSAVRSCLQKLTVSKAKNILCKKCNVVVDDAPLFENHNMLSHGHFTCLVCLATFTSRNNMKRHIRLHTGIKPYVCHKCPESFARNDDFKRHLLRHTFEKPFRCTICKTGYSDRSCVKGHMMKEHQSRIFHICPQCGESYVDSQKFQQHKKTHPEFQDYRCTLCLFTGSNALMYNKHMLTHGPPKKYTCTHCDIIFTDPFPYTSHLKKHKGDEMVQSFACCFCGLKLHTYDQFQRHEHSHIQAKQHTCTVCQKQFRYPSNLREHMLSHMRKPDINGDMEYVPNIKTEVIPLKDEHLDINETNATDETNSQKVETIKIEENNNTVDLTEGTKKNETAPDANQCNESSEYWCTECNHGFGTEDQLQEHIMNTHEHDDDEMELFIEPDENGIRDETHIKATDRFSRNSHDSLKGANDDIVNDSAERTRSTSDSSNEMNTHIETERNYVYDDNTQDVDLSPKVKRAKIFDEETVVDSNDDDHQESENNTSDMNRTSLPFTMTSCDQAIVNDAMRQVHAIQSRFGIKPSIYTDYRSIIGKSPTYSAKMNGNAHDSVTGSYQRGKDIGQSSMSIYGNKSWHSPETKTSPSKAGHLKIPHKPVSVTLEGMKMKIKREVQDNIEQITPNFDKINDGNSSEIIRSQSEPVTRDYGKEISKENDVVSFNQYSKSSVLGMDTEFSSTPNRGSPTTLNLKIRNPGFEKVVTPEILFKTKAPFTCEVCEETFLEFDSFDQHGVAIHRRYICSYCGKAFTSRPNRERHVRYHTGVKPYKCELCDTSFFRGDDLKYHRTTKHADVRPFSCGACTATFSLPKELEKHLRVYPDHRA